MSPEQREALKLNNTMRSSRGSAGGRGEGAASGRYCIYALAGVDGWGREGEGVDPYCISSTFLFLFLCSVCLL